MGPKVGTRRVFLLGIDGATWKNLMPWIRQGHLPHFQTLVEEGMWGELASTTPPLSPPAWTSIFTGVNPGKHSIYSFVKYKPARSYTISPISSHDRRVPAIWDILTSKDRSGLYMNIPFSYPPPKIKGVFTSGLGTPGVRAAFVHPVSLKNELLRLYPRYSIDFTDGLRCQEKDKASTRRIYEISQLHMDAFKTLFARTGGKYNFYCFIVRSLDVIQHFYWRNQNIILEFYKQVDGFLGWLLSLLTEDDVLVVCSDHGFQAIAKRVYINDWLCEVGLLKVRRKTRRISPRFLSMESIYDKLMRTSMKKVAWKIKRTRILPLIAKVLPSETFQYQSKIDWRRTKVFFWEASFGLLRLNIIDREPEGAVPQHLRREVEESVIQAAASLIDEENQKRVIAKVERAEDIYSGPYILPDLVLLPAPGYIFFGGFSKGSRYFEKETIREGEHDPHGVWVLIGAKDFRIRSGVHTVYDIAPTILSALRIKIPDYMDGEAIVTNDAY